MLTKSPLKINFPQDFAAAAIAAVTVAVVTAAVAVATVAAAVAAVAVACCCYCVRWTFLRTVLMIFQLMVDDHQVLQATTSNTLSSDNSNIGSNNCKNSKN